MSFRNTFVTEFIYAFNQSEKLNEIEKVLKSQGCIVSWSGHDGMGYFHGIIKDMYPRETNEEEVIKNLKEIGVEIKIVYE